MFFCREASDSGSPNVNTPGKNMFKKKSKQKYRQHRRNGWRDEGHCLSAQSVVTDSVKNLKLWEQRKGEIQVSNRLVTSRSVLLFGAKLLRLFISFVSSRPLQVSGFTRSPETIECETKRETATHFALLVASRCNTTTLTFGSRPQHQNINTNVSVWNKKRRSDSDLQAEKQTPTNQL